MPLGVTGRSCDVSPSTTESRAWPPSISTSTTRLTPTRKRSRSRCSRRKTRSSTLDNSSRLSRGHRTQRLMRTPTSPTGGDAFLASRGKSCLPGRNKRTAVVVLRSFLNLNGYDMTLSEEEIFELAVTTLSSGMDWEGTFWKLSSGSNASSFTALS